MGKEPLNIGVLISGRGSNLQAIIDGIERGEIPARISIVISNEPGAYGLERARNHGIPTRVIDHRDYPTRKEFETELMEALKERGVALVVLAGFMRVLTEHFLSAFPQQVVNIHPALLPSFPGVGVQEKAAEYGVRFSGCTVHFVNEGVDAGPIIAQAVVPVYPTDTGDVLADRILRMEHQVFPRVIRWIAEGRVRVEGRRVFVDGAKKNEDVSFIEPVA
ncbi:MAG: phosphoribosylglycinamide formyltransferase [Deltaproteobacteria bacterium]|nr:MAG: phosphoribosylglycinamide formyltransferase [Deltaproteobacteria bacterium]